MNEDQCKSTSDNDCTHCQSGGIFCNGTNTIPPTVSTENGVNDCTFADNCDVHSQDSRIVSVICPQGEACVCQGCIKDK